MARLRENVPLAWMGGRQTLDDARVGLARACVREGKSPPQLTRSHGFDKTANRSYLSDVDTSLRL